MVDSSLPPPPKENPSTRCPKNAGQTNHLCKSGVAHHIRTAPRLKCESSAQSDVTDQGRNVVFPYFDPVAGRSALAGVTSKHNTVRDWMTKGRAILGGGKMNWNWIREWTLTVGLSHLAQAEHSNRTSAQ